MDTIIIPGDLPAVWRARAETLRTFGDPNTARLWDIAAVELERSMELFAAETLSLAQAARESGYTADHLGSLVKRGKIPNAGRTNAPRIRRSEAQRMRHTSATTAMTRARTYSSSMRPR